MPTWILVAICILCWGTWAVVEKLAVRHASPMMMQVIGAYAYSAIAPVIFLYMKGTGQSTSWTVPGIAWTSLACLLATVASFCFQFAIQRSHVHLVVGFTSTYPVLTFLLCWLFLGEPVTWQKLVGIVAIVVGTILMAS
jgi:transporter family protein